VKTKITKRAVDAMQSGEVLADSEVAGFRARHRGTNIVYELRYRTAGRRAFLLIGRHGSITPDQARKIAKLRAGEVASGDDPAMQRETEREAAANTVNAVLDDFVARYLKKQGLRSADTVEKTLDRLVRPRIGTKPIYDVKRVDITKMLDAIEDANGPVMADRTLAYLRKAFNWQATRDDRFTPPIVRGMARTKSKERARTRVLDDQEIRDLWQALDELGDEAPSCYPRYVRALLLTAQRRSDVSHMHSDEIDGTTWIIPGARYKTKIDHAVPLIEPVLELIGAEPKGFVFSSDGGKTPFSGYSKAKAALDRTTAELRKAQGRKPMGHWTPHDLRRTARSLMSRAGVPTDIGERVLGHVIPGVRAVYDRYAYLDEKRDALARLAAQIGRILHPGAPVVAFPKRGLSSTM
jgi:integrase